MSDIHGNFPALRAVLEDIHNAGCTRMFVLGDIINGVDPHGCLELLKTCRHAQCLKGNAEFYVLTPDLETFPRREEPLYISLFKLLRWFKAHLSEPDLEWLQRLPGFVLWNGACLAYDSPLDRMCPQRWRIHGLDDKYQELCYHARGITRDMAEDELETLLAFMESHSLSQVFCGHTHTPFCWRIGDKLICNVGSVGMPLDGDPRPSWVMVEETPGGGRAVTIRRVSYDIDRILRMVDDTPDYPNFERSGMQDAYKTMLTTGIHWKAYI